MAEQEESDYAGKLRLALECEDWSINKLARELAGRTGNAVGTERSAIRGYLKEAKPQPWRAELIADIMGMPELASVENARQSGSARLERRLEEGLDRAVAILEGQKTALATQDAMLDRLQGIEDELRALRESLEAPARAAARTPRKTS